MRCSFSGWYYLSRAAVITNMIKTYNESKILSHYCASLDPMLCVWHKRSNAGTWLWLWPWLGLSGWSLVQDLWSFFSNHYSHSLSLSVSQGYKRKTEAAKKEYLKALAAYRASLVSKVTSGGVGHVFDMYGSLAMGDELYYTFDGEIYDDLWGGHVTGGMHVYVCMSAWSTVQN